MSNCEMFVYPFTNHPAPVEEMKQSKAWLIFNKLATEEPLTEDDLRFLHDKLWDTNMPWYKIGGWVINFTPFMNQYWVDYKYYGIVKEWAINKTLLRKHSMHPSWIKKIVLVEEAKMKAKKVA